MSNPSQEISFLSIAKASALLRRRKISPVDLTNAMLTQIDRLNPELNAYLTVLAAQSSAAAKLAEREIQSGKWRGPLHGIPICLKDNIETRGIRTTAGSLILQNYAPSNDAAVVRRLHAAGAIILGKTNLHEFAYGITSINPHYGWVRNPWNLARISGGSSGGSAAAIAAGMAYGSVGTDTGGSIRTPSSFCGIVGLKPTYGRVSLSGVIPLAPSLDHVGPMARTVADVAILLEAIAGASSCDDSAEHHTLPRYAQHLRKRPRRFRLGWPVRGCFENTAPEIEKAVTHAVQTLREAGALLREVSLEGAEDGVEAANIVARVEATAFHTAQGWFPARANEYGADVRSHLEAGFKIPAIDFLKASAAREKILHIFHKAFADVDAILVPTMPIAAPAPKTESVTLGRKRESLRFAILRFSRLANFTGLPAISVPCGFTHDGLPIGLQIIGPHWSEVRILQIAHLYERSAGWRDRHLAL